MANSVLDGILSTDIYGIVDMVNKLKSETIDESEDTLAAGIYGSISAIESVKILSAIQMGSELSNEVFPSRAKYDKNVITHAVMHDISDINATPSSITVILCVKLDDINKYSVNDKFIIDRNCQFFIGDIEFHPYYDIILTKIQLSNMESVYSARYDNSVKNNVSHITNPYLNAPTTLFYGGEYYVCVQCELCQVTLEEIPKKIITSSLIDNKTFMFDYENQLADFVVEVTENDVTTTLTPIFEGATVPVGVENYCNYLYLDDNTIRVKFERISYSPSINAEILVKVQTTLGAEGNFEYAETAVFNSITSKKHGYTNLQTMEFLSTNPDGGLDSKSADDLRAIIPKEALARGAITTTDDVINYFNMVNSNDNVLTPSKKVDNQIERTYHTHLIVKDKDENIVPTNTIKLLLSLSDFPIVDNDRYVLPAGCLIRYNPKTGYGYLVHTDSEYGIIGEGIVVGEDEETEEYLIDTKKLSAEEAATITQEESGENYDAIVFTDIDSDTVVGEGEKAKLSEGDEYVTLPTYKVVNSTLEIEKVLDGNVEKMLYLVTADESVSIDDNDSSVFYYTNPYALVVNKSMLYTSSYLTIIDEHKPFYFSYINQNYDIQFIGTRASFARKFITDKNTYKLDFSISQNIQSDVELYEEKKITDDDGNSYTVVVKNRVKVIILMYRDGHPYRYKEGEFLSFNKKTYTFNYRFSFKTSDVLDQDNNIRIENVGVVGQTSYDYGYFNGNTPASIYVLVQSDDDSAGRHDLDQYVPGLNGYVVTNVFKILDGIDFYINYSGIMTSKIEAKVSTDEDTIYDIASVPVLAYKYSRNEELIDSFVEALNYKKAYIDNALDELENSFGVDFKFYNTYGPSRVFTLDNKDQYIDRVNIQLNFRLKLKSSSDNKTPSYILTYVKSQIENLNGEASLHIPNLITDVTNKYKEALVYFEFTGIDGYGPGIQHIYHMDKDDFDLVPEFININVLIDEEGNKTPDINIEVV